MNLKDLLRVTGIPVLVASLCCLAPVVLVLLGLGSVTFAASLTNILDGQYRWIFDLAGVLLLISTLIFYFRRQGICTLDQAKRRRNEIINLTIISVIATVIIYLLFFYGLVGEFGRILRIWR